MTSHRTLTPAPPLPIADDRIEELMRVCRDHNVFPLFLESHYPPAREHPVDHLLKILVPEVAAVLQARPATDIADMFATVPFGMLPGRFGAGHSEPDDPVALERLALGWLVWRTQASYFSWDSIVADGPTGLGDSAVLKAFPELAGQFDKHGLLHLSDEMRLLRGGIAYRDHLLHYHQGLRRGFGSNPNFDFFDRLIRYEAATRASNTFRVGIDHRRLMHLSLYQETFESDYWFGARFKRERLDDPKDVGVTALQRLQPSPLDFFFGTLLRTEVFRSVDGDVKTFEIEEVNDLSEAHGDYILNRYVHAERDMKQGVFQHLDGAVKVYSKEQYPARIHPDRRLPDKSSLAKFKVFRIDGQIDSEARIDLTLLFFRGNELLLEYFDPEQYEEEFGPRIAQYRQLVAEGKLKH